jgi:cytochrome P450
MESTATTGDLVPVPSHVPAERVVDFDVLRPRGIDEVGPHEAWRRLQTESQFDLVWTPRNEGHWIALRGKYVRAVYRDTEHFSNRAIQVPKSEGMDSKLVPTHMDPPEHTPYREVLNKAIGPTAVKGWESLMRRRAAEVIEGFAPRGECEFVSDYAREFAGSLILTLLDLPVDDAPRVKGWIDQMTRPDGSMSVAQVFEKLYAYVEPIIGERVGQDGDDLITLSVNSDVDGQPMSNDKRCGFVAQLLVGGLDTVINMTSFFMEFLATSPQHRRQLADAPAMIPKAVEELIRRFPVIAEGRLVKRDTELDGITIKTGDFVLAPSMLAGLDEQWNECPMEVDFGRKRIGHVAFAEGPHMCPGQYFARRQMKISLEEWFKRIPEFEIAPGTNIAYRAGSVVTIESLPLVWEAA